MPDLIDELCLTTSPVLAAGQSAWPGRRRPTCSTRRQRGQPVTRLTLAHVLADDELPV